MIGSFLYQLYVTLVIKLWPAHDPRNDVEIETKSANSNFTEDEEEDNRQGNIFNLIFSFSSISWRSSLKNYI